MNNRHFTGMGVGRNGHLFFVVLGNQGEFCHLWEMVKAALLQLTEPRNQRRMQTCPQRDRPESRRETSAGCRVTCDTREHFFSLFKHSAFKEFIL